MTEAEHYPGENVTVLGRPAKLVGRSGNQGWMFQFVGNSVQDYVRNEDIQSLPVEAKLTADEAYADWPLRDADDERIEEAFKAGFEAGKANA